MTSLMLLDVALISLSSVKVPLLVGVLAKKNKHVYVRKSILIKKR